MDEHVPCLLSFSPKIAFHENPLYKSGKLILQDKASCFPAIVLAPPATEDARVIDATAAPGNKTSLLSALMQNKGKVAYVVNSVTSSDPGLQALCFRTRQKQVPDSDENGLAGSMQER